ncbi:hydroxyacid dehydrogenase [Salibacterium qingdaonense]|uniref:D-3-phosphoglycerate dehydrogenase n=1 Tax=Salibacterium qingdaonense TaxID=266892 RepID=A0A1I4NIH7_9BACI|nr:hydroxyacid dehydrogenase [Salibacterium qingdaonense]SFM15145.1 D-3-phosphoglycerate dehydrogenase [Salibacterium qingdaonense]
MKIVITEMNWPIGMELLKAQGYDVLYDPDLWKQRESLEKEAADADALIVRNQTKVDETLLRSGSRLKVVGRLGVGLDNIDLDAAKKMEIEVITAKNANAASVAEYVISAMFHVTRPLAVAAHDVKSGGWDRRGFTKGEVYGKMLGLVGTGETGIRAANRAKALGMNVTGYDPFVKPYDYAVMETGIRMTELDEVLRQSDFVSLHIPLTSGTKHLLNKDRMKNMKPGSWLINSSRGGVVEENDLYEMIKNEEIGGAFLDVIEHEPIEKNHPLLELDNCLITPHIAGLTEEAQERTSKMIAEEIIQRFSS